jgi:uncharacterized protein (TIGR00251 family)
MAQPFLKETPEGMTVTVFIQPRSSKNGIVGLHGDALKIRLTAPPVEGAANKMCIEFLAKQLGISKSNLSIISGHSSRTKRILVKQDDKVSNPLERLNELFQKKRKPSH